MASRTCILNVGSYDAIVALCAYRASAQACYYFVYMSIDGHITVGSSPEKFVANPVRAEWILEGSPVARIQLLSTSEDGTASTYFWDCTAGRFNWFYAFDETFHILEGEVTLKDAAGESRRVVAGDTVFFPLGSAAEWTVHQYVRKLAFCRVPVPQMLTTARNMVRSVRRMVGGNSSEKSGSGLL
jgi:uncharacterized protein